MTPWIQSKTQGKRVLRPWHISGAPLLRYWHPPGAPLTTIQDSCGDALKCSALVLGTVRGTFTLTTPSQQHNTMVHETQIANENPWRSRRNCAIQIVIQGSTLSYRESMYSLVEAFRIAIKGAPGGCQYLSTNAPILASARSTLDHNAECLYE